jgi:predicted transcriptional regulator
VYKVDQVKLAEILDVSKMAVSKAIANGRLSKSVRKTTANKYEIELVTAIFEWFENADLSKDRGHHKPPEIDLEALLVAKESKRIRDHYQAFREKIEYEKVVEKLIPRDQVEKEVFEAARIVRERLQSLPDNLSHAYSVENDPAIIRKSMSEEIEKSLEGLTHR